MKLNIELSVLSSCAENISMIDIENYVGSICAHWSDNSDKVVSVSTQSRVKQSFAEGVNKLLRSRQLFLLRTQDNTLGQ